MKIIIEPTGKIVELNSVPARIWEGIADGGTKCLVWATRVSVDASYPEAVQAKFREALQETKAPSPEVQAIPFRLIL